MSDGRMASFSWCHLFSWWHLFHGVILCLFNVHSLNNAKEGLYIKPGRQQQTTCKPNTCHIQLTYTQRHEYIIYDGCSLKERWDFSLPTFISMYKLILWSAGMCVLLHLYMAEIVSICYYTVPPMEIPVQDQGIWTEPKATNYFIKPPWNLVNKIPLSIIDPGWLFQVSCLWWDHLTINNFLSHEVKS